MAADGRTHITNAAATAIESDVSSEDPLPPPPPPPPPSRPSGAAKIGQSQRFYLGAERSGDEGGRGGGDTRANRFLRAEGEFNSKQRLCLGSPGRAHASERASACGVLCPLASFARTNYNLGPNQPRPSLLPSFPPPLLPRSLPESPFPICLRRRNGGELSMRRRPRPARRGSGPSSDE